MNLDKHLSRIIATCSDILFRTEDFDYTLRHLSSFYFVDLMCTVPKVYRLPKGHLSAAALLQSAPVYCVHVYVQEKRLEVQTGEKAPRMHDTDQKIHGQVGPCLVPKTEKFSKL